VRDSVPAEHSDTSDKDRLAAEEGVQAECKSNASWLQDATWSES